MGWVDEWVKTRGGAGLGSPRAKARAKIGAVVPVLVLAWVTGVGTKVVVEARQGIDPIRERELVAALARSVSHRTGQPAGESVEAPSDHLSLKLYGGLTRVRLIVTRDDPARRHAELELPLGADLWEPELDAMVRALYPEVGVAASPLTAGPPTAAPRPEWPRWLMVGGAAVATVVGVGFMVHGFSARSAADADGVATSTLEDEVATQRRSAWIGGGALTVGFGLGVAAVAY